MTDGDALIPLFFAQRELGHTIEGEEAILGDFTHFGWGSSLVQVRVKESWLRISKNPGMKLLLGNYPNFLFI